MHLVFEGSNFAIFCGCMKTNPMDKKKAISEFHFAPTQNKCIVLNDIYFQILFTIVGSLT